MSHVPVLLDEVLEALAPEGGKIYVDGTFGAGGYTRAVLEEADCYVLALDRDPSVRDNVEIFKEKYNDRFQFVKSTFGDVETVVKTQCERRVDGFVLDIGVSSMQIDDGARGFSFQKDGPLDMRMDRADHDLTAETIVNEWEEARLKIIFRDYGEERFAGRVAKAIIIKRTQGPIKTTLQLATIIRDAIPKATHTKIDPATRCFQALRIAVNDELKELEDALNASINILDQGGHLVVVSFHSLEDKIVKRFLDRHSGYDESASRHQPAPQNENYFFSVPKRKAVTASEEEIAVNSRARSARLRMAVRTAYKTDEGVGV